MINFSFIRASMLSAALLLTTALASPSLAETSGGFLPELSPRQIAGDVQITRNAQTGASEFTAPSFDPFEENHDLAGTAQLRSVSDEVALDGNVLRGGAILDLSFYYNSNSSDPYDNRGYEEAVFLSGEYAPIRFRDHQILECSQQVQDVVYYHEDYYAPSFHSAHRGLYRPYRHYTGFNSFSSLGFGLSPFAFSSFATPFNSFGGINRGFNRGSNRARIRNNERRSRQQDRLRDRRDNGREDFRDNRHDGDSRDRETRRDGSRRDGSRRDGARRAEINRDINGGENRGRGRDRDRSRSDFNQGRRPADVRGSRGRRGNSVGTAESGVQARTSERKSNQGQLRTIKASIPKQAVQPNTSQRKSAKSSSRSLSKTISRTSSRTNSQAKSRSNSRAARSSSRSTQSSTRRFGAKRMIALTPMTSLFGRSSARVSSSCAREEKLSLHIPQDRLDAARFDGLTILVLSRTGEELPVYIPPNYIEGYRQAVGRQSREPVYSDPHYSAPQITSCPTGTVAQPDGSCLTTQTYGYPTR